MPREYEIVAHSLLRYMTIFLVRLVSRTTHIHREMELGMVAEGSMSLRLGGESCLLSPGDIYIVNPLEPHEFSSGGTGALVLSIQIDPKYLESILPDIQQVRFTGKQRIREHYAADPQRYDLLSYLFIRTAYEYVRERQNYEYSCLALAASLLGMLRQDLRPCFEPHRENDASRMKAERMISITDYIEENFTRKLLLEDIARRENLSMTYLSHFFRDAMGISFQDYLKEKRFEYACSLIVNTRRSILDISVSSGFSDARYLTQMFRERFACTPREFRMKETARPERMEAPAESRQYFLSKEESSRLLERMTESARERITQFSPDALF